MYIFRIRLVILQFFRFLEILGIIIKHGFNQWLTNSKTFRKLASKKYYEQNGRVKSTPERIRILIEDLGPTYIKFGQILADRPDMISERLREELKKLQSKARPLDNDTAIDLIEKELKARVNDTFKSFDTNYLAAASIGQVYKAVLKTGEEVIIKIQRPNIENKIRLDIFLMKFLAARAVKSYPELAAINLIGFVDEFNDIILKELDYFNEASNLMRFREMFKDDDRFYAPKVYSEYSTKKLLVMERIHGIAPDEIEKLKAENYDLNKIAENGADILLKMILRYGFFHADPHSGNIFILPENRICFIDYGMVASLKPVHMSFLANFTLGFVNKSSKTITESLVTLCGKKFFDKQEDMEFDIEQVLQRYGYVSIEKIDISQVMNDCFQVMVKYELAMPSSIYMLLKALATIQKFAFKLNPNLSITQIVLPYAKELIKIKFSPKKLANKLFDTVNDYITLIQDFPSEINEILYKLKEGKLIHEIQVKDSEVINRTVRQFSMRIALVLLLGFMFMCSTVLIIWGENKTFGEIFFGITAVLTAWLMIKLLIKTKV